MRFPTLATTSPVRAWLIGLGLALVITEVPFIAAPLTQIAIGWYVLPLGFAIARATR